MRFALGPDIRVRLSHFGHEEQPLMIVDNVLADPDAMIAAACAADYYVPEHTRYPGLNAPLPDGYYQTVIGALRGPMDAAFGLPRAAWLDFFGFFALATTPESEAAPIQKIPHYDTPDPGQLALVHYLCRGDFGGTAFFRHVATGFESVGPDRHDLYVTCAAAELEAAGGKLTAYAGAQTPNYRLIAEAERVFDRLIVYRSNVLHSAILGSGRLDADPSRGRLTANGFVKVRPSAP